MDTHTIRVRIPELAPKVAARGLARALRAATPALARQVRFSVPRREYTTRTLSPPDLLMTIAAGVHLAAALAALWHAAHSLTGGGRRPMTVELRSGAIITVPPGADVASMTIGEWTPEDIVKIEFGPQHV